MNDGVATDSGPDLEDEDRANPALTLAVYAVSAALAMVVLALLAVEVLQRVGF